MRLTQVVLNLLNNAVKYSPNGARIALAVDGRDGSVVTRIRDEGIGIAEADLPRVFEMFYQGNTNTDDSQGGLGLGLALVRQLVDLHGGSVEAHSAGPGKAASSSCGCPRSRASAARRSRSSRPRRRDDAVDRRGASWWSTTTATRRKRWR